MFSKQVVKQLGRWTFTKISIWQIFLKGSVSTNKCLIDEILESPLKLKNTRHKSNITRRNKDKKLNTICLVSSIFFYHRKVSLISLFILIKIRWKHVFFETIQSHWRLMTTKRLFLIFRNLTVIKYQNLCESK